jgi:quercetin dioxygenase-like cupin family protein
VSHVFSVHGEQTFVIVNPRLRAAFLQFEPGQPTLPHRHEHGDETFLVLQGQAEVTVETERRVLRPGELCVAARGQMHTVRSLGEVPARMFLVVAPNVEPTHTFAEGDDSTSTRMYGRAAAKERGLEEAFRTRAVAEMLSDYAVSAHTLADRAADQLRVLELLTTQGDAAARLVSLDGAASSMRMLLDAVWETVDAWNLLAARLGSEEPRT